MVTVFFQTIQPNIVDFKTSPEEPHTEHQRAPTYSFPQCPAPTSTQSSWTEPPARPTSGRKKRKTKYLQKPKILYVGDSIAQNANIAVIEKETQSRICTKKAYSSVEDKVAMWPHKNITDVTKKALTDTFEEDKFTHLIIAAPSVDIT